MPVGQLLYWHYCCTLCNLRSFSRYNIYLLTICRWWMVVFLSVIILSVLLSIVFEWKWNYTRVVQCLSPFVNFHCVTYWWWVPHVQMSQQKAASVVRTCSCFLHITWVGQELWNIDMFFFKVRISKATNKKIKTWPCYQNTEWHNGLRNTFSFSRYRFEPCLHQVF